MCITGLLRRTSWGTLPWSVSSSISHGLSSTNAAISEPFQRICSKRIARYMIQPGIYTVISLALYLYIWHKGELVWVCESDKMWCAENGFWVCAQLVAFDSENARPHHCRFILFFPLLPIQTHVMNYFFAKHRAKIWPKLTKRWWGWWGGSFYLLYSQHCWDWQLKPLMHRFVIEWLNPVPVAESPVISLVLMTTEALRRL